MSELAPPPHPVVRRGQRLEAIRRREEQISILIAEQRLEVAALAREDLGGLHSRYVADELALLCGRSPRQGRNRLDEALMFADFPAVHAKIGDRTWLIDHADAVLSELAGSGLDHHRQQQVLALVLSRPGCRTPWELRAAVRTAIVVLFPDHALARAQKATTDRDVQAYADAPGCASLVAHGPAAVVAAMMASLDALSWPAAPGDTRTAPQRRFDALKDLVCGRAEPGQWQVQLLVTLATIEGRDELPGEIPGFGPIPAPQAREILAGAELRRVVVDDRGQLVAVDSTVHRPDQPLQPVLSAHQRDDDEPVPVEPDPEAPSAEDALWLESHTDRTEAYADQDARRSTNDDARRPSAARPEPAHADAASVAPAPVAPAPWSEQAFARALARVRTDPVRTLDLSTDRYAVPGRLKRHLVLRDRTCVFPGCPRRAEQCEKDHRLPWPRGSTCEANLDNKCKHHHQAKHDCFGVELLDDGTVRWTTPTGHTYDRPPRPVLEAMAYLSNPDVQFGLPKARRVGG
ncbi:MAG TPA: hypothetical protein VGR61_08075 [Candidatus Dormibacteraeota bacterium]|nr:hypothetical protein [Candidatus Dormibacteraeota bacterium]